MHTGGATNPSGGRFLRTGAGLVIGVAAALLLYLWQSNIQLALAVFVIVAHTATVAIHFHGAAMLDVGLRRELGQMEINRVVRRTMRLLMDPYFWWSICFGCGSIIIACWFAGMHNQMTLTLIGIAWGIIAVLLAFDMTLMYPTTRCRACGYQLIGLLDHTDPSQRLTCPECGRRWTKAQLCLVPPGWRSGVQHSASTESPANQSGPLAGRGAGFVGKAGQQSDRAA